MIARIAAALVVVCFATAASAQEPVPPPEPTATAVLTGVSDEPTPRYTENYHTDVIVGLPLAVRYQHRIGQTRYWGEVGGGLFIIIPEVFAGVRADCGLYEGRRNSFWVRPGLDAHFLVWPFGSFLSSDDRVAVAGGVSADVDLVWRCRLRESVHGELGIKLGVITLIGRNGVLPLPTTGLMCGLQF